MPKISKENVKKAAKYVLADGGDLYMFATYNIDWRLAGDREYLASLRTAMEKLVESDRELRLTCIKKALLDGGFSVRIKPIADVSSPRGKVDCFVISVRRGYLWRDTSDDRALELVRRCCPGAYIKSASSARPKKMLEIVERPTATKQKDGFVVKNLTLDRVLARRKPARKAGRANTRKKAKV